ncbi:hypothetical protein KIPB_007918, partial [Kipferlia bialata]|eukprot:g7918.t1
MSDKPSSERSKEKDKWALRRERQAGLAKSAVDPNTGKTIDPNIPAFISDAPWYAQNAQ